MQQTINYAELSRKVCISKLPPHTTDEFVLKLLQACGQVTEWKRFKTATGEPKETGIADYTNVEGVYTCVKFLNNLPLEDKIILAKANQKTTQYFEDVKDLRRVEYRQQLKNRGEETIPEIADLKATEEKCNSIANEILPYEFDLITGGEQAIPKISKAIERLVKLKEGKLDANEVEAEEELLVQH